MQIVAISTCSAPHAQLLKQVHRDFPITLVLRPVDLKAEQPRSRTQRLRKFTPQKKLAAVIHGRYRARQARRLNQKLCQLLGQPELTEGFPEIRDIDRKQINSPDTADLLNSYAPDVLIVAGGPLLSPAIFEVPRLGAVNVHYGIAPNYRGEHTLFWPLYRRDFDHLGVTLHYIDRGVDTGRILAQGFPALDPQTDEADLWARCSRLTAEMLADFLEACQHGKPAGKVQPNSGENFKWAGRLLYHDMLYQLQRRLRWLQIPSRPERKELFFDLPLPVADTKPTETPIT